jgi:hypothetical protein
MHEIKTFFWFKTILTNVHVKHEATFKTGAFGLFLKDGGGHDNFKGLGCLSWGHTSNTHTHTHNLSCVLG